MSRSQRLAGILSGIWLGSALCGAPVVLASYPITVLTRSGKVIPGIGTVITISKVAVNDAGSWVAQVSTDADSSSNEVVLRDGAVFLRENQPLTQPPGAAIGSFGSLSLDGGGHGLSSLLLRNLPADADSGLFYEGKLLIQEHDLSTAPQLSPSARYTGFLDAKINAAGRIALVATVDDPVIPTTIDHALVVLDLDGSGNVVSERAVAKEGQVLPGQTQAIADFGAGPHASAFNSAGQMLYFADLTGIFLTDGVIYRDQTKIAQEGDPSPVPGRRYEVLANHGLGMNGRGEVAFKANLDGDSFTDEDIVVEGEELVQRLGTLPVLGGFHLTSIGKAEGPVPIDDERNVLWFGDWDNPDTDKDTALFLNDFPFVHEGDPVEDSSIASFVSGENGFAMSPNGRYVVLRAVLADGSEVALQVEVQGPPPVPDGGRVPGPPMRAARSANGTDIDVTWDVAGCPASRYNLFYGDLASVAASTYTGAVCALGTSGHATFTPPGGSLYFVIVSADDSGVEGVHGYDSRGLARRASAQQQCGVVGQIRSSRCP